VVSVYQVVLSKAVGDAMHSMQLGFFHLAMSTTLMI
jgi:hypothetical protein